MSSIATQTPYSQFPGSVSGNRESDPHFAMGRVTLVADVYFIPVNYPQAEASALNLSIVGMALYLVAIAAMIITAFSEKITKD